MQADIITIGDEILIGQIVNTNAAWLGAELTQLGFSIRRMLTIPDLAEAIRDTLDDSIAHSDLLVITGGLGPTNDDKTKDTLKAYFNGKFVVHVPTLLHLEQFFATRNRELSERNRRQAEVPDTCEPLLNRHGTAPGMLFRKQEKWIASLPGVPFEMKGIYEEELLPRIKAAFRLPVIKQVTVLTVGLSEAETADRLSDWENSLENGVALAYLPSPGILRLRITISGENEIYINRLIKKKQQELEQLLGAAHVFGTNEDQLEAVLGQLLRERGATLATAESCTGGNLAHLITSVPGASAYYRGSIVAYANEIKQEILGVTPQSIHEKGAVSQEVVEQMAQGARARLGTQYAIATSGIAGPTGGTPEKPVGTVWIAVATPNTTVSRCFALGTHRERCISVASYYGLNLLRTIICENS